MKFIDTDVCSYQAFDNGVVLKIKQDSLLEVRPTFVKKITKSSLT